ncbi:hypothetical protein BKA56DRAFT_617956 [Ilyonectria sp. MPI-CAGE-AT-0026]|nr:hypothetical protein BKA56DRAFT_617956 [Ilyonectria sp. MPI-CAGE-AT-0026]
MATPSPLTTPLRPQAATTLSLSPPQVQPRQPSLTFVARSKTWFSSHVEVAGFFIALVALVVTFISVFPAFTSQRLSEKALAIAEWTALKDFREQCIEQLANGSPSLDCEAAINKPLPRPPPMEMAPLPHTHSIPNKRGFSDASVDVATTSIDFFISRVKVALLVLGLCLMCVAVFVLKSRKKISSPILPSHSKEQWIIQHPNVSLGPTVSTSYRDNHVSTFIQSPWQSPFLPLHNDAVTTSSHPSDTTTHLRHREIQERTTPSGGEFARRFSTYDPASYVPFDTYNGTPSSMMDTNQVVLDRRHNSQDLIYPRITTDPNVARTVTERCSTKPHSMAITVARAESPLPITRQSLGPRR